MDYKEKRREIYRRALLARVSGAPAMVIRYVEKAKCVEGYHTDVYEVLSPRLIAKHDTDNLFANVTQKELNGRKIPQEMAMRIIEQNGLKEVYRDVNGVVWDNPEEPYRDVLRKSSAVRRFIGNVTKLR